MATANESFEPNMQIPTGPGRPVDSSDFSSAPWPLWLRIVFRFVFSYLVLYNLSFPTNFSPGAGSSFVRMRSALVIWVGAHVLHLSSPITYFPSGSGDKTSDYVQLFCIAVFAVAAALIWSLLDRKRTQYRFLHECLRIYIRYVLAFAMFGYGFDKLPHGQFRSPGLDRLIEPYGAFAPMGVLWYFMGVSKAYALFSGVAEVVGGFLLLFRRTVTIGALVVAADMLNVALLNYSYDVPVKLYSTSLLLMAVFLLVPELRAFARFFLLRQSTALPGIAFPWKRRWMRPARIALKTAIIVMAVYGTAVPRIRGMLRAPSMMAKMRSPLYGIYNVEGICQDAPGASIAEIAASNWRRVAFANSYGSQVLAVVMADDSMPRYRTIFDTAKHTISLSDYNYRDKGAPMGVLTYSRPDADHLILRGTFNGKPADITLRRIDASKYRLFNTGFHWINEMPNDM